MSPYDAFYFVHLFTYCQKCCDVRISYRHRIIFIETDGTVTWLRG